MLNKHELISYDSKLMSDFSTVSRMKLLYILFLKGDMMKYTWRIIITSILLISNAVSITFLEQITYIAILSYIANLFFGWIIGYQIDKYHYSKRELGSAKKSLVDYSHAMESVPLGIGITNEHGQFEFVNDAHARLYGYSKEEFLAKNWQDCYPKEVVDHLNKTAIPRLVKQGEWRGETIGVREDGSTFPQELILSFIDKRQKVISVTRDITEQKQYIEYIEYIAEHNDLTKLPNRHKLFIDIPDIIKTTENTSLLFVDFDRFKMVNDTLGHDIGDELLVVSAKRLLAFQNELIRVYHLGGDEFIFLIQNSSIADVETIAAKIINCIKEPYNIKGNEVSITTSIGISRFPDHTNNFDDLIKMADTAMYYAKLDEKNRFKLFSIDLKIKLERDATIESELRKAISNSELFVHYQPKFDIKSSNLVGMEALIRWENAILGNVSPMEFIPVAEDIGLISEVGNWVMKEVISQLGKWKSQGYPLVKMSVNVSQRQFRDRNLVEYVKTYLSKYKIDPRYFEVEITESEMEDFDLVIPQLKSLKEIGIGISIDDFGTGYSSLNFIKLLPVDTLKIDQSFVRDMVKSENSLMLVKTIIEIGNTLSLSVVAEGIESEEHLILLKQLDCPIGQGYYFSRPLGVQEIESVFFREGK